MSNDSPEALNTPIVEEGLKRIPFFNGRVLTAEDLQTEQMANATERKRLGRALGTGVLDGLFVHKGSGDPPTTVTVESGLALAPSGHVVQLPEETDLSVVSSIEREETAGTKGKFADCARQTATVTTGSGAYLLVVRPAAKTQGRVPQTRLGGDGAAGACGAKHRVEGATLSLVRLDTDDKNLIPPPIQDKVRSLRGDIEDVLGDPSKTLAPSNVSRLRNLLAHACLRTPQALRETADLYTAFRDAAQGKAGPNSDNPAGPTDVQAYSEIGPCAVPIGLLYWVQDRILFVDNWSVRRRVHRLDPQSPAPATDRRQVEGEATFYQFQAHLADLPDREPAGDLLDVELDTYFHYLPPACLVPLVNSAGRPGIAPETFLGNYPAREPVYVEGHRVPLLLSQAALTPPVDLNNRTALRVYKVRESDAARGNPETLPGPPLATVRPFLLLASGYLPRIGDPRYDLSHWNYANFLYPADR